MEQYPQMGDIVIYYQENGDMNPAIIVKVLSSTSVILGHFVVGGMVGTRQSVEQGNQPGQWQFRKTLRDQESTD